MLSLIFFISFIFFSCVRETDVEQFPPLEEKEGDDLLVPDSLTLEKVFVRVAQRVTPAVVNISALGSEKDLFDFFGAFFGHSGEDPPLRNLGSGFLISREGYILTNNHVIGSASQVTIRLSDEREFSGKIIAQDPKTDLALLKIPPHKDLPVAFLGDSAHLEVGEWAIAIGNPFGLDRTVTVGVISAIGRVGLGLVDYEDFIQTDASINFGNSGGPLLNARGEVVGINTAIVSVGHGIGFAVPINVAKKIVNDVVRQGRIVRGWLGVGVEELPAEMGKRVSRIGRGGVLVVKVMRDSPAWMAGIRSGDIIMQLQDEEVRGARQFQRRVADLEVGMRVTLLLLRESEEKRIGVIVGEMPSLP